MTQLQRKQLDVESFFMDIRHNAHGFSYRIVEIMAKNSSLRKVSEIRVYNSLAWEGVMPLYCLYSLVK